MPIIIIDHKRKRAHSDYDWTDAMGIDQAKDAKLHQIQVDPASDCLIDKFICKYGDHKFLMGKKIWAKKDKSNRVIEGFIRDVYPSRYLLVKWNGKNVPVKFENVFSIKED
jgi:hypothetical protein